MTSAAPAIPRGTRVYAIGDVHGRLDLLDALVARIREDNAARPRARVRIVLLGDVVDRGPDSAELVSRLMALTRSGGGLIALKGNHEAMMVHALRGNRQAFAVWLRNGGDAALASWGLAAEALAGGPTDLALDEARRCVPFKVVAWLSALPIFLHLGDYLFVHAGIRPGVPLYDQEEDDMLWIRDEFLDSTADHPWFVVHGHTVTDAPDIRPRRIGIDTGAYLTGVLTAIGLEGTDHWLLAAQGTVGPATIA